MILAITQARLGSTRLPEKILKPLGQETALALHLKRLKASSQINKIVIATTFEEGVEKIINIAKMHGAEVFQGSTDDVLDRFYQAAIKYNPDYVIRLTSDCPLLDANLLDEAIKQMVKLDVDYYSNCFPSTFPDGFDFEIFRFQALKKAWQEAKLKSDREHVTPYIWRNSNLKEGNLFKAANFSYKEDYSYLRMTLDNASDLAFLQALVENMGEDKTYLEYINVVLKNPKLQALMSKENRNEGYDKSLKKDT